MDWIRQLVRRGSCLCFILLNNTVACAATLYVWQGSSNPTPPFSAWTAAAHTLQDAVDKAQNGDTVLVTNGVYAEGGWPYQYPGLTNRINIYKPIVVKSVNGPGVTTIQGVLPWPGNIQTRCAYVGKKAVLSGFTLWNGQTLTNSVYEINLHGGGVLCDALGVVTNCEIVQCSATYLGGGVYGGTLRNCTLSSNRAYYGGGAAQSILLDCAVNGNSALDGGGAYQSSLTNCTVGGNSALNGGGAAEGVLINCLLVGNGAIGSGPGGGASDCTLYNCTVAQNSGVGVLGCTLYNCITYYNNGLNYSGSTLYYSCATPMPTNGSGNISSEPAFVNLISGDYHLRYGSPCIDSGTNLSAIMTNDLDGNPRPLDGNGEGVAAYDMGAYEYVFRQPHVLYVWPDSPNPAPPYTNWDTAAHIIQDAVEAAQVSDKILVTNGVYASGAGIIGTQYIGFFTNRVLIDKAVLVESVNGPSVTVIQGAADSAGGNGNGAIRCVYVGYGGILSGFTLTNGHTRSFTGDSGTQAGGGAVCVVSGIVTNCIMTNNFAYYGGGACAGTLYNCTISGNQADESGGGTYNCVLWGCTVVGNSAPWGGGGGLGGAYYNCLLAGNSGGGVNGGLMYNCTVAGNSGTGVCQVDMYNCIVFYNTPDYCGGPAPLLHSCAIPLQVLGVGNITNEPLFVDQEHGDFRLKSNSPCINSGNNAFLQRALDLDGNPRIVGGTIDMGAYEFQNPTSLISYAWLQQFGLPTDGSADFTDPDKDAMNNWQEWVAGTNPTNALSVLRMTAPSNSAPGISVSWQGVSGITYFIERSTNLAAQQAFSLVQSNLVGQVGMTTYFDTNVTGSGPFFYRVGVQH